MAIILNDQEILKLIHEKKIFPKEGQNIFQAKDKKGHKEQEITIPRDDGSLFKIIFRQNKINILDFSFILGYMAPRSNVLFRLRRYNGKSHEHTNGIEKDSFYDFHVHMATERYQQLAGFDEDDYAEVSDAYSDIHSAMECFVKDCNIVLPTNDQMKLF